MNTYKDYSQQKEFASLIDSKIESAKNYLQQLILEKTKSTEVTKSKDSGGLFQNTPSQSSNNNFNYLIDFCYNGERRQMAILGELVAKGKEINPPPPLEMLQN